MSTTKQSDVRKQGRTVREDDEALKELTLLMANLSIEDEPRPLNLQTGVNNAPPSERSGAADSQPAKPRRRRLNWPRQRKEAKPKRKKKNFRRRRAVREDEPMNELTRLMANLSIGDQPQMGVNNAPLSKRFGAADGELAKPQMKHANKRTLDASTAAHDHSPDRLAKRRTSDGPTVW